MHPPTNTRSHQGFKDAIEPFVPLIAGGVGGTTGAIFTCPLEVVKTRLQSSNSGFPTTADAHLTKHRSGGGVSTGSGTLKATGTNLHQAVSFQLSPHEIVAETRSGPLQTTVPVTPTRGRFGRHAVSHDLLFARHSSSAAGNIHPEKRMNVFRCLRFIYVTEGVFGLFKGLGPNLMGVAPSRAIYFWAYQTAKKNINSSLPTSNGDTPFVHVVSAMSAGFSASTTTNPIWLIKTRLQLDRSSGLKTLTIRKCIKQIHSERGILGFWRGVTASYWGISETVIHFVVYEALKKRLEIYKGQQHSPGQSATNKTVIDIFGFMACGACSKTCATCLAYPHEVARTRLREQGDKYKTFWQTLGVVYREEGRRGLYRGLVTQLVRQIPNTAIMMSTYELTMSLLYKWLRNSPNAGIGSVSGVSSDLEEANLDANSGD